MEKYFNIAINNTMKRIITYVFIAITTMCAYGGDYPPSHFRMGMYTLTRRQDVYLSDCNRWDALWFKDTLVLYSNFHFLYKSEAYFGTTYYSYGEWNYQNEIFVLNSVSEQEDTLQLQSEWEKAHCKYGSTTRHFPVFRFREMKETKLYNIDNYGVSFKKKKHQEVMMYDLEQKVNFDEFLYRFIHDSKYQSRVLRDSYEENYFILVKYPNTHKVDVLCHSPLEMVDKKTVRHKYYSLKNSPFAFEKLPKVYSILTVKEKGGGTECSFKIGDVTVYKMVFYKWYDRWILEEIVISDEGLDILRV